MTLPQFPEKYDHDSLTSPDEDLAYYRELNGDYEEPPEAVVLTYSGSIYERAVERLGAEDGAVDAPGMADLHRLAGTDGRVGVAGNFGIGAPGTAIVVEVLAAAGVEAFCIVGYAGALTRDLAPREAVVADRALRDEGTSHHYLPEDHDATATPALVDALREAVAEDRPVRVGPTWTVDAAFRETAMEARRLADRGYLTVEMEAATLFSLAEARDLDAGAVFAVSDYVTPEGWDRRFHEAADRLFDLVSTGRDALLARSDGAEDGPDPTL